MPLFDGVVLVDGEKVPVILGVEEDGIRLSSNGTEIGEWNLGEYRLEATGGDTFVIAADDDSLTFVPHRPDAFARSVGIAPTVPEPEPPASERTREPAPNGKEAPPPRPLTRALFYTLAGTTVLLGLWALVQLVR